MLGQEAFKPLPPRISNGVSAKLERMDFRRPRHPFLPPPASHPHPNTPARSPAPPASPRNVKRWVGVGRSGSRRGGTKGPSQRQRHKDQRRLGRKIGEVGQGHGEGPAESVGPTLTQPRRANSAWEPVCAAPWREEAGRRRCGPEVRGGDKGLQGARDTHNRGRDRDTRRNKRR